MQLLSPPPVRADRLGLLAGSFNPPTRAHAALAEAALSHVHHVLMVLPGQLPHKNWDGAPLSDRVSMLKKLSSADVSVAVSQGGLYIDIVREAKLLFPHSELHVVCGRDAAERIATWDYGEEGAFERMLGEFQMLVAGRNGRWTVPSHAAGAVRDLDPGCWDEYSSTAVREAIAAGRPWKHLIPDTLCEEVWRIYGP